jgi:hypothetical protein
MPSAQQCAERLREQAHRTLLPQIKDLEQELQSLSSSLLSGVRQLEQKLEILSHTELPATETVLSEILEESIRRKDAETNDLALFARSINGKETQEEILGLLLDSAKAYAARVALFAVRGDNFVGWSSRGFTDLQAKKIRSCSFLRSELAVFQEAIEKENSSTSDDLCDSGPLDFMKESFPGIWHIVPLRAMQRPVAVLLIGMEDNSQPRQDSIIVLTSLAVLRIENIALRILYELSSEKAEAAPQKMQMQAASAARATAPESASGFEHEPEPAPVLAPIPSPALQDSILSFLEPEPTPAAAVEDVGAIFDEIQLPVEPTPAFIPDGKSLAKQETWEPPTPPVALDDKLKTQPQEQLAEEEKLHAEAKRFARLLVSEIKLYNEHHVREGRENRDLYLRLKRDIDRSREMYEKRVSAQVSRRIDYFHDEIIRILGDNDPSTLGSDYPGPRVES